MTTASEIETVERSVEKVNIWLRDLAAELGTRDRAQAYRVLRAVLHALRDRVSVNESAQLSAQLPLLIRGIYFEGWVPSRTPLRYHKAEEFLERVAGEARLAGATDASYAVAAVANLLRAHITAGELEDVLLVLPAPVRALFQASPAPAAPEPLVEEPPRDFAAWEAGVAPQDS